VEFVSFCTVSLLEKYYLVQFFAICSISCVFFFSSVAADDYDVCVIQGNQEGALLAESLIHNIIGNQPLIES
jgi:hypothetical protein